MIIVGRFKGVYRYKFLEWVLDFSYISALKDTLTSLDVFHILFYTYHALSIISYHLYIIRDSTSYIILDSIANTSIKSKKYWSLTRRRIVSKTIYLRLSLQLNILQYTQSISKNKWVLSINLKPWNIINTRPKTWILCTSVAPCFIIQKKRYAHDFLKGKVEFFHARIINFLFTDRSTECICVCVCVSWFTRYLRTCVFFRKNWECMWT